MTKFGLRSTGKLVTGTLFHSIISDFKLRTHNWLVKMLLQVFAEATLQAVSQSVAKSSKMILFNAEASCSWGEASSIVGCYCNACCSILKILRGLKHLLVPLTKFMEPSLGSKTLVMFTIKLHEGNRTCAH